MLGDHTDQYSSGRPCSSSTAVDRASVPPSSLSQWAFTASQNRGQQRDGCWQSSCSFPCTRYSHSLPAKTLYSSVPGRTCTRDSVVCSVRTYLARKLSSHTRSRMDREKDLPSANPAASYKTRPANPRPSSERTNPFSMCAWRSRRYSECPWNRSSSR